MPEVRIPFHHAVQRVNSDYQTVYSGTVYSTQSESRLGLQYKRAALFYTGIPDILKKVRWTKMYIDATNKISYDAYYWDGINNMGGRLYHHDGDLEGIGHFTYEKDEQAATTSSFGFRSSTDGKNQIYADYITEPGSSYYFNKYINNDTIAFSMPMYWAYNESLQMKTIYYNMFSNIESTELVIVYEEYNPFIKLFYPIDVYINKNRNVKIEYETGIEYATNDFPRKEDLYIDKVNVRLLDTLGNSKNYINSGELQSLEINSSDLNDFHVGEIFDELTVISSRGIESSISSQFILVGASDAPTIISITQNSYPEITWECDNQISWQMVIKKAEELIFDTGMVAGTDKYYKLPIMLDDGVYSVEMRALNNYGFFTMWSSEVLVLNPPKPNPPEHIIVSATNDYGIYISCTAPSDVGTLYVVRRKDSNSQAEILGEYKKGFIDNNVALNKNYEYSVRNYVEGYADGEWYDGIVTASGIVIRDADNLNNYCHIWIDESDFDIRNNDTKSDVLISCIGRPFPVLELGEWVTSTRTFTACVSNEEYKQLVNMKLHSKFVYAQMQDEVIPCYIEITNNGKHASQNRMIGISLTRIDGDKNEY